MLATRTRAATVSAARAATVVVKPATSRTVRFREPEPVPSFEAFARAMAAQLEQKAVSRMQASEVRSP